MNRSLPARSGSPDAVSTSEYRALDSSWELVSTEPGSIDHPTRTSTIEAWLPATVPGTVAEATGPRGSEGLDHHDRYDEHDWWYRCAFDASAVDGSRSVLRFDGLATLATVWLNGEEILSSTNMFLSHRVDVSDLLTEHNELVIAFHSLAEELRVRRPRPRWKTRLVENQRLRWFRTTLLGRIPGWTPRIEPVGPWKGIGLETVKAVDLGALSIRPAVHDSEGTVRVCLEAELLPGHTASAVRLLLDGVSFPLQFQTAGEALTVDTSVAVGTVEQWWPHTHGPARLYDAAIEIDLAGESVQIGHDRVGFRSVEIDRSDGGVNFIVNGVPVFCRGACWTTNDIVTLVGDPVSTTETLALAAEANANMIRVGGTMVYETDAFYRTCDELGLMVWQDFMFANMDYPVDDPAFAASIEAEVSGQLDRLGAHPCVVAFCGGSEIEQQAAMFGAARDVWLNDFFGERLPGLVEAGAPATPYWSSSPTGGALPFHVDEGLGHYYGVGAYKRPLDDCRLAGVKFTPECLGFSNLPEPESIRSFLGEGAPPTHLPAWKAGVPRDSGAGWDFEDIRDHYLELLFGVDAVELRSHDLPRYHRLSRMVTGRVMATVFDEWRSTEHPCGGGLVWFLQDLRPGAGWGIIDSRRHPKAVWHHLRRAWAPLRVTILDRGVNGLVVEAHNDRATEVSGDLHVRLFGTSSVVVAESREPVVIPARGSIRRNVEADIGHFADPNYAYRFGPRGLSAVAAAFESDQVSLPPTVFWPTLRDELSRTTVTGQIDQDAKRGFVEAPGLARGVRVEVKNGHATENYFDMTPGSVVRFGIHADESVGGAGYVEAENDPDGRPLKSIRPERRPGPA